MTFFSKHQDSNDNFNKHKKYSNHFFMPPFDYSKLLSRPLLYSFDVRKYSNVEYSLITPDTLMSSDIFEAKTKYIGNGTELLERLAARIILNDTGYIIVVLIGENHNILESIRLDAGKKTSPFPHVQTYEKLQSGNDYCLINQVKI